MYFRFNILKTIIFTAIVVLLLKPEISRSQLQFEVSFDAMVEKNKLDGRMLLMISKNPEKEPRFQIMDRAAPQQIFGLDVNSLAPDEKVIFEVMQRLQTRFTHPLAGRPLSYQKCFEVQARQVAKLVSGELVQYRPLRVR